jgi:hypothetical protein
MPSFSRMPSAPGFQPASSSSFAARPGSSLMIPLVAGSKSSAAGSTIVKAVSAFPSRIALAISARLMAMLMASRTRASATIGRVILKP